MSTEQQKDIIDFLPLGSIIILKGGTQKVVVIARGLMTAVTQPPSFFDYGGCLYPQGLVGDQILYFQHKDIMKVIHIGYRDEDDALMIENINNWFQAASVEKGSTDMIK